MARRSHDINNSVSREGIGTGRQSNGAGAGGIQTKRDRQGARQDEDIKLFVPVQNPR